MVQKVVRTDKTDKGKEKINSWLIMKLKNAKDSFANCTWDSQMFLMKRIELDEQLAIKTF